MNTKNIFWGSLLLVLFVNGCQLFLPPNVETVVVENYLDYWRLSPNGEYLAYGASRSEGNFLLDLTTRKEYEFDCHLHWWDNYHLGCYGSRELFVIDVKTLKKTPLNPIDLTKPLEIDNPEQTTELFVKQKLENAELIYHLEWFTDTIYILAPDYQLYPDENYLVWGVTQPDKLLAPYTVITVPDDSPANRDNERTPSPNGLYYYDTIIDGFAIFTIDSDEVISEFTEEDMGNLDILGWASDNSGVYFITYNLGFSLTNLPKTIRKLKIPDE